MIKSGRHQFQPDLRRSSPCSDHAARQWNRCRAAKREPVRVPRQSRRVEKQRHRASFRDRVRRLVSSAIQSTERLEAIEAGIAGISPTFSTENSKRSFSLANQKFEAMEQEIANQSDLINRKLHEIALALVSQEATTKRKMDELIAAVQTSRSPAAAKFASPVQRKDGTASAHSRDKARRSKLRQSVRREPQTQSKKYWLA